MPAHGAVAKDPGPLARACDAPFDPPRTVGDVVGLLAAGRLRQIRGLGRRHLSEIEAALAFAGLVITGSPRPERTREQGRTAR